MLKPRLLKSSRGSTFLSTIVAAAILLCAIGGAGIAGMRLGRAMKKAELANLAVSVEANLVNAFQNKMNFPDPDALPAGTAGPAGVLSPNVGLMNGTLTSLPLNVYFSMSEAATPLAIAVNVQSTGTQPGTIGYLNKKLEPCGGNAFSDTCVLKYEVRLKKTGTSYAFSYQVDANPAIVAMSSLGDITQFDAPLDPGLYRADHEHTKCNAADDVFMTGVNRDTGEAYCAKKPASQKCADGTLPKGLLAVEEDGVPTVKLICTENKARVIGCPNNYSLQQFDPKFIHPENYDFQRNGQSFGKCVFAASHTATLSGAYPESPVPYMKSVSGTFCPPYYKASGDASCRLVEDQIRNASISAGLGRCAPTAYKNCTRQTYTDTSDNGAAHAAWVTCAASPPSSGCGAEPANPVMTRTCSIMETSSACNGQADVPSTCAVRPADGWSRGIAYAVSSQAYNMPPLARPKVTFSGRNVTCTFEDQSDTCDAPATDYNGADFKKKDPKWFGGVQVSGVTCTYDPSQGFAETVEAQEVH